MTAAPPIPELQASAALSEAIAAHSAALGTVDEAELSALREDLAAALAAAREWQVFRATLAEAVGGLGYAVVRGLATDGGTSLLIASAALGAPFETYARGRIVKRFRMSPWTRELSHTLQAGNFHTDGNVAPVPPIATAMQCEREDPGGDAYAELRVAHLPRLLRELGRRGQAGAAALAFLQEEQVAMAHERSTSIWSGRLVEKGTIRYHPESLRVANARIGGDAERLEERIAEIHEAAMAVAPPFHTRAGDVLLVSNRRALHYRGACSVRFTDFPTRFESRSVLVLHCRDMSG
jgi:hypothetical protein